MSAPSRPPDDAAFWMERARNARTIWDLNASMSALFTALRLAQRYRDHALEHLAWMDLATTQRAKGEHAEALVSLDLAVSAARTAGDGLRAVRALSRRCACLIGLGRMAEADTLWKSTVGTYSERFMNRALEGTEVEGRAAGRKG